MNTTPRTRSKDKPRWYSCFGCGHIYHKGAFHCSCGHKRTGKETLGMQQREDIMLAWKLGKDEAWISRKFNCSNKTARDFLPLSMRKRNYRVMQ